MMGLEDQNFKNVGFAAYFPVLYIFVGFNLIKVWT